MFVMQMKKGQKARIECPPDMMDKIAAAYFDIEIVKWRKSAVEDREKGVLKMSDMTAEEQ